MQPQTTQEYLDALRAQFKAAAQKGDESAKEQLASVLAYSQGAITQLQAMLNSSNPDDKANADQTLQKLQNATAAAKTAANTQAAQILAQIEQGLAAVKAALKQ